MHHTAPSNLSQTERQEIISFLISHPVGVISTVSAEGNPHGSAIYFSVDDGLNITFTTKQNTQKFKNISGQNKVMLVAFDAPSQASVQVSGTAARVTDADIVQDIYRGTLKAARRTGEDVVPPVAKITAGRYVAFKITPDNIWLSEYGWGDNFANSIKRAIIPAAADDSA